ncbi:hypothetical protein M0R45_012317 [Rubus argutus]|uniref:Uncharacterized protein n=1 Tax=Rubus argutus TaxID=59490 RepID=A0AAW1YFB6_RUBAR
MATITNFLAKPPLSLSSIPKTSSLYHYRSFSALVTKLKPEATKLEAKQTRFNFTTKATAAPGTKKVKSDERVVQGPQHSRV